jgi:hypothetical protein
MENFMKYQSKLLLCLLFVFNAFAAQDSLRGTLSSEEGQTFLTSNGQKYSVHMTEEFKYALDKVVINSPNYIFELEGEIRGEEIHTSKVPTIYGGEEDLSGFLHRDEFGQLKIDDQPVRYGRTKVIYQDSFDQNSKDYYVDKFVTTQGQFEDGEFVINAIIEKDLLSASSDYSAPEEFNKSPKDFIIDKMPLNKYSQAKDPFNGTLYSKKNYSVTPGESVLIVTLSGRQGDAPGSAAGHFTVGMGEVQDDLSIKGEVFNFYFVGPKEVLAGNTDLVSYFGHLIQGQQNYRPTYTLFAYGVDKNKLRSVRDELEKENHKVRTKEGLKITPGYNCTTTSTNALRDIGIYGNHKNFFSSLLDVQNLSYLNPFSYGARNSDGEGTLGMIRTVSYTLKEDPQHYIPRPAFESFVENFSRKSKAKKMGIKRVDYVYIPQTPSKRQVGGISYDDPIKEGKKVLDFDKKRNERRNNEKKAKEIIANSNSSEDQLVWARDILKNEVSWEEDQKLVREFLYNTID